MRENLNIAIEDLDLSMLCAVWNLLEKSSPSPYSWAIPLQCCYYSETIYCFVMCLQYIIIIKQKLESEAPAIVESSRPEDSWPREGSIKFSEVDMRYREGLPLVLKSVNLDIKAQEKIGIVGRTGSGEWFITINVLIIPSCSKTFLLANRKHNRLG